MSAVCHASVLCPKEIWHFPWVGQPKICGPYLPVHFANTRFPRPLSKHDSTKYTGKIHLVVVKKTKLYKLLKPFSLLPQLLLAYAKTFVRGFGFLGPAPNHFLSHLDPPQCSCVFTFVHAPC